MSAGPQLLLELDAPSAAGPAGVPRQAVPLVSRLYAAGVPRRMAIATHNNRRVLVSVTRRGALRVHAGYAMAPDAVIAAIARWARPRVRREERRAASRIMIGFPVHDHAASRAPVRRARERPRPGDGRTLDRLAELHRELNRRHFGGQLAGVRFSLSAKMRRRLGEFRPPEASGDLAEIIVSRHHLRAEGWAGVRETVAHELVHQWQAETGRKLAHDSEFRRQCRAIGIDGRAVKRFDHDILR